MHLKIALWVFLTAMVAPVIHAQQISPLIYELATSGPESRQEVSIANTGSSPVAFEVFVTRRSYSEKGDPVDVPEDKALTVEPAALWIEPGQSRKVGVRYQGPEALDRSAMYLVTFRQAPVQLTENDNRDGIALQYEFATIAQVVRPGQSPEIAVDSIDVGEGQARVRLSNRGSRYGRINSGSLTLHSRTICLELAGEQLADRYRATWLLPGESRVLDIALPPSCEKAGLQAQWQSLAKKP